MDSRCMPCLCTGRAAPPCAISECRCDDNVAKLAPRSCERQVLRRSKKENWGKTSDWIVVFSEFWVNSGPNWYFLKTLIPSKSPQRNSTFRQVQNFQCTFNAIFSNSRNIHLIKTPVCIFPVGSVLLVWNRSKRRVWK